MTDLRKLLKAALALTVTSLLLSGVRAVAQPAPSAPRRAKPSAGELAHPKTPADAGTTSAAAPKTNARVVEIKVTEKGYEPAKIAVKRGEPLRLRVTRTTDQTCANEILVQGTELNVALPLNQSVEFDFTPARTGEIKYGCAMGMMLSGVLLVE